MSARVVGGIQPVREALRAGAPLRYIAVSRERKDARIRELLAAARSAGIEVRLEAPAALERLAAGIHHQGVVAVAEAKPVLDLDSLLQQASRKLLLACDGIEDPHNLGAMLRAACGAGVDGVLLPARRSAGLTATVERVAAGALEYVAVARVGNLAQAFEACRAAGYWMVGLEADAPTSIWDHDLRPPTVLVVGGEGRGLHELTRKRCDALVSIPLAAGIESLNAGVAAGVALFEAARQRRAAAPPHTVR